jgi:SAM-dependent methyltransferase
MSVGGLVEATKQGLFVTYRLADRSVADLLLALRRVAETRAAARRAQDASAPFAVVAGDASKVPFDSASFDLVIAVTALGFVGSPAQAVREIARVLRPGGRLVVGELGRFGIWAAWRRSGRGLDPPPGGAPPSSRRGS